MVQDRQAPAASERLDPVVAGFLEDVAKATTVATGDDGYPSGQRLDRAEAESFIHRGKEAEVGVASVW
jgi:hypothetical protein